MRTTWATEVLPVFLELAAIPSPSGDEAAVAAYVRRYLRGPRARRRGGRRRQPARAPSGHRGRRHPDFPLRPHGHRPADRADRARRRGRRRAQRRGHDPRRRQQGLRRRLARGGAASARRRTAARRRRAPLHDPRGDGARGREGVRPGPAARRGSASSTTTRAPSATWWSPRRRGERSTSSSPVDLRTPASTRRTAARRSRRGPGDRRPAPRPHRRGDHGQRRQDRGRDRAQRRARALHARRGGALAGPDEARRARPGDARLLRLRGRREASARWRRPWRRSIEGYRLAADDPGARAGEDERSSAPASRRARSRWAAARTRTSSTPPASRA